jgi:hypothetical protein
MFVISPEVLPNIERISATTRISSLTGFTKTAGSSAYMLVLNLAILLLIGVRKPSLVANSNNLFSGSIARMKSMGGAGPPALNLCSVCTTFLGFHSARLRRRRLKVVR